MNVYVNRKLKKRCFSEKFYVSYFCYLNAITILNKRNSHLSLVKIALSIGLITLLVALLSSCSMYDNVTGYFNTYYNVKKLFSDAEYEIENAPQKDRDTNYFAIYNIPKNTEDKLDKVIEKCSKLIQFYPKSAWIDDAIFMIGKSYIYKGENESAIRKFKELTENFPESYLRYEAKLWIAVSSYQMKKWVDALIIIRESIPEIQKAGEDDILLKLSMLEAQILIEREDYQLAATSLMIAALTPGSSKLMNHLFNKLGQCYERMNEYGKAANAYGNGAEYKTDFAREFQTRLKQGVMLSLAGKYEEAFESLETLKEDKLKSEEEGLVDLEIANNYWRQNDSVKAFELYTFIDTTYKRSDAAAKCHFQRGVIYEKKYLDLKLAQKFYDKAKSEFPNSEVTGLAQKKAMILSNYFKSMTILADYDSLLQQAIIAETTQIKIDSAKVELGNAHDITDSANSFAKSFSLMADTIHKSNDSTKIVKSSEHTRRNRSQQGQAEFQDTSQIDDADLTDLEEVTDFTDDDSSIISNVIDDTLPQSDSKEENKSMKGDISTSKLTTKIDSSRSAKDTSNIGGKAPPVIAKAPLKPDSIRSLIAKTKLEIAALFFNDLNLLDSGMVWYNDLVTNYPNSLLVPRALYATSEIYHLRNDSAKVDSIYKIILDRYTETDYAIQIKKNLGIDIGPAKIDSAEVVYKHAEELLQMGNTASALQEYESVAKDYPLSPFAPKALYAIGWIYETLLVNNDSAAAWYKTLIGKYPKSIYADEVKPKVAVKDDPNSLSQFIKIKDIQAVPKTEAPKRVSKSDDPQLDKDLPRDEQIRRQREREKDKDIEEIDDEEPVTDEDDDGG